MDFKKYKNTIEYPEAPIKPVLKNDHPNDIRKYADAMKKYASELEEHEAGQKAYREKQAELTAQFRIDLLEELGMTDHPKASDFYSTAWDHGHSYGFEETFSCAQSLVEDYTYTKEQAEKLLVWIAKHEQSG